MSILSRSAGNLRTASIVALATTFVAAGAIPLVSQGAALEKIDCHGGRIQIDGQNRRVELFNCKNIDVRGAHNDIAARLPRNAVVLVSGNDNRISLQPANGASYSRVRDTGLRNTIEQP